MWIDPTSSDANETLLYFGSSANTYMKLAGRDANGYAHLTISVGGTVQQLVSTVQIPLNRWTNLALTMGGGTATFYVNGSAAGSAAISYRPTDVLSADTDQSADSLYVGRDATGNYFTGRMVDVRFYNVAIAPAEVVNEMLRSGPKLGVFYAAAPVNFSNTELESGVHSGYTRTLSAWINPRSAVNTGGYFSPVIDSRDENNNGGSWEGNGFGVNNGHIVVMLDNTGIWDTGVSVQLNQWQHVTVTLSGTTAKLFVNGVQRATRSYSANTSILPAKNYRIGWGYSGTANTHFDGQIFDLEISDKVVAPTAAASRRGKRARRDRHQSRDVNLSVLGADNSGESNLTYTWVASGPGTAKFSANGANAAKNTSATFSQSGAYLFTVLITNATGQSVTASVTVTVSQVFGGVAPRHAACSAAARNNSPPWTSSANRCLARSRGPTSVGTITSAGLYTAPAIGTASTVTASDRRRAARIGQCHHSIAAGLVPERRHVRLNCGGLFRSRLQRRRQRQLQLDNRRDLQGADAERRLRHAAEQHCQLLDQLYDLRLGEVDQYWQLGTPVRLRHGNQRQHVPGPCRWQRLCPLRHHDRGKWRRATIDDDDRAGDQHLDVSHSHALRHDRHAVYQRRGGGHQQRDDAQPQQSRKHYAELSGQVTIRRSDAPGQHRRFPHLRRRRVGRHDRGDVQHGTERRRPHSDGRHPGRGLAFAGDWRYDHPKRLGAESAGESNLTYTWTTTGTPPAPVVFSSNGNNAAKSTTATFTKAGTTASR